ncbi:MAG: hypothetical protein ACI837_000826 [Crocinitomicaceae bacterium]|jgi:hypothetical protein
MTSEDQRIATLPAWEQEAEFNRFFIISIALIIVACMGGLAVGFGGIAAVWSLILILIPTMTTLSLLLAVAPMRYIIFSAASSIIIDISLLIYFAIV